MAAKGEIMSRKFRTGVAAVLVAGMSALGVGCSGQPLSQQQQQGIGNFIFMAIYIGMCQANYGVCPFPLGPSLPVPPSPTPPAPVPDPALASATG
jgi:hypothetical protein